MSGFSPYAPPPDTNYQNPYQPGPVGAPPPPFNPPPLQPGGFAPSPYQECEPPRQDTSHYQLYDRSFTQMTVAEWPNTRRDESEGLQFWRSPDCFQAETFLAASRGRKDKNDKFAPVVFYVLVIMALIMFSSAAAKVTQNMSASSLTWSVKLGWKVFGFCQLSVILPLVVCLVLAFLGPRWFMRGAIFYACIISVLYLLVSIYYFHNVGALGVFCCLCFVGFFCNLAIKDLRRLGDVMLEVVAEHFKWSRIIGLFISMLILVNLMAFLWGFSVWLGLLNTWNGAYSAFALLSYWYIISVLGQITYQAAAQLSAYKFFLEWTHGVDFKTSDVTGRIWQNMGIACVNGILIPLLYPFQSLARLDPVECKAIAEYYVDDNFAKFVVSFIKGLHGIGVSVSSAFDKSLVYPSEEGSVYSAIFGVTRKEGCRRYAEIRSKNFVDVIQYRCSIDYLFGFFMIAIEACAGFTGWNCATKFFDMFSMFDFWKRFQMLGGAAGFFLAFGFFQITKQLIKGITDAIIICFYECPHRMHAVYPRLDEPLRDEYVKGLMGTRGRREAGVTVESLSQPLVSDSVYPSQEAAYVSVPSYDYSGAGGGPVLPPSQQVFA